MVRRVISASQPSVKYSKLQRVELEQEDNREGTPYE